MMLMLMLMMMMNMIIIQKIQEKSQAPLVLRHVEGVPGPPSVPQEEVQVAVITEEHLESREGKVPLKVKVFTAYTSNTKPNNEKR